MDTFIFQPLSGWQGRHVNWLEGSINIYPTIINITLWLFNIAM